MISILIPIYNTQINYIQEAFDSIDNQTFQNFEVIVVNDGSNKETEEYLNSINNPKYKIHHKNKAGISEALNFGLKLCSHNIVCRMDGDDIMMKDRLETQYNYFITNNVDVLGSQMELFGSQVGKTNHPLNIPKDIMRTSDWFMNHPTIMFNRDKILKIDGYDSKFDGLEDLELWCKCLQNGYILKNLPNILVRHRRHSSNATVKNDINLIMQKINFVRSYYYNNICSSQ